MEKIYLNPFSITSARLRCLGATLLMLLFAVAAGPVAAREQAAEAQQPTIQAKGRVVDTNGA
ncbi:hypothetical protein, partial [uncultured Alistipes sp.]